MRPPTRAFLRAVCRRLDLDPSHVTRVTLMPGTVTMDRLVHTDEGNWLEPTETMDVLR